MPNRTAVAALLVTGLAGLVGCRAGTSFSGSVDIAQWTPDLSASALKSGGSNFSLVANGGVDKGEDLWTVDLSLGMQAAAGSQLKPYQLNLGYWHGKYDGAGPASDLTFAGATFDNVNPISTSADFKYYKLTFEEPDVSGTAAGGSLSSGILGLHYLDFSIAASDGAGGHRGVFDDSAPMFVIGYRIEQYAKGGLMYYLRIEYMDLDTITLGGAEGEIMDLSGGVRWAIRGNKAAICIGYKTLEAELDIDGNKLNMDMDGAIFSLFLRW
ncbi:MAG: hypothetical protein ACYTKD_06185 [Planctomycetota bacterium]|jgi:hypothetical protein